MGDDQVNIGTSWTMEGGTLIGWVLHVSQGSPASHSASPALGSTPAASKTKLCSVYDEAQISQTAFENELPTTGNPSVKGWYDGLSTTDQDDIFEAVKSLDCP